ncbi:hypothetical protein DSM14862_03488 (plasmid) [Sulfitobacter indolifex]|nr:hypothetical protein DSM14862_03488 [Sulfitobacter indolifex]
MNTLGRSAQSALNDIASFQIDLDRPVGALSRPLEAPRITEHDRFFAGALIFQIAIEKVIYC